MRTKRPNKDVIEQQRTTVENFVKSNINKKFNIVDLTIKFDMKRPRLLDLIDLFCCRNGLILYSLYKQSYFSEKDCYLIKVNEVV